MLRPEKKQGGNIEDTRRLCKHDIGYQPLNYWTPEEDALLLKQYKAGVKYNRIRIEGRTNHAIYSRLQKLKAQGTRMPAWTAEEVAELKAQYLAGSYQNGIIVKGRKTDAIVKKLQRLREAGELF